MSEKAHLGRNKEGNAVLHNWMKASKKELKGFVDAPKAKSKALEGKKTSGEKFNEDRFHKYGKVSVRRSDEEKYKKELSPSKIKRGSHKTLGEWSELHK